ncbi:MAG: hypothetical protein D6701_14140 [Gemmatimonadetes bacterium]|nr:MAG: hypothetical protein D6701_14140 [Gemmatimonadota bacterium]
MFLAVGCSGGDADPEAHATEGPPASPEIHVSGFAASEAVRHDPEVDVYLVANISGDPTGKDDDGFISRVSPDGEVLELRWIDGADEAVTLHAPKGMALKGDTLFVADIDVVRAFDRHTGAPLQERPVPGAEFLNDVAVGGDGTVYVTDTGAGVLYRFEGTEPVVLAAGEALGRPNGVDVDEHGVVIVAWDGGARRVDPETGAITPLPAPDGERLDGVVLLDDGSYLVSSWDHEAVLRVHADGAVDTVLAGVPRAADIGLDPTRRRVLVPTFDNVLHGVPLPRSDGGQE